MNALSIYTDGACSGNPGPGGWGVVLLYGTHRLELSGYVPHTTNNRMELQAVIEGLKTLKRPSRPVVYSDSQYVVHALTKGWVYNWQRRDWRKSDGKQAENIDLWQTLLALLETHEAAFVHVRGHADNVENNRCDQLAREAIEQFRRL